MISRKPILAFIILAIATSISSCSSFNSTPSIIDSGTPKPTNTPTKDPTIPTPIVPKVNVTLYTIDSQCQELIPQPISVPAAEALTDTVGKIIEQQDRADFELSGYRVEVTNGIATIDFRLSPQSKRQFVSLSSCEQFALFGSLRKTLMSNAEWEIKDVRFTEQGEEIVI
ncbi:sporulation/spore germination protein [Nodularia harveyana UHCC-0300]|uniref:Sporulation/spore germination protein n=1 Tax=Nodularia harveyana UHCC-0300 TaxID=2974287 RepID=A0ABU5UBD8_9CYAN|nr:sporulation/spore germination protein [Nodularia harveyana]MEA5580841.1 sporulation/spore germination protein [Nodularia harveyana UHCC-0300]